MAITSSNAFVSQLVDDLVYIMLDDAATFERIPSPANEAISNGNGKLVRFKAGYWNGVTIIFQFWPAGKESNHEQRG